MYQVGINKGIILRCTAYQIVYQVGINKGIILRCTAYQIVYQVGINKWIILRCTAYQIVYQVGINKGIILRCTAYQISRLEDLLYVFFWVILKTYVYKNYVENSFLAWQRTQRFSIAKTNLLQHLVVKRRVSTLLRQVACIFISTI